MNLYISFTKNSRECLAGLLFRFHPDISIINDKLHYKNIVKYYKGKFQFGGRRYLWLACLGIVYTYGIPPHLQVKICVPLWKCEISAFTRFCNNMHTNPCFGNLLVGELAASAACQHFFKIFKFTEQTVVMVFGELYHGTVYIMYFYWEFMCLPHLT